MDFWVRPLSGALLNIENTAYVAQTDANGRYAINYVPGQFNLKVSSHGYEPRSISLNYSQAAVVPMADIALFKIPPPDQLSMVGERDYVPITRCRLNREERKDAGSTFVRFSVEAAGATEVAVKDPERDAIFFDTSAKTGYGGTWAEARPGELQSGLRAFIVAADGAILTYNRSPWGRMENVSGTEIPLKRGRVEGKWKALVFKAPETTIAFTSSRIYGATPNVTDLLEPCYVVTLQRAGIRDEATAAPPKICVAAKTTAQPTWLRTVDRCWTTGSADYNAKLARLQKLAFGAAGGHCVTTHYLEQPYDDEGKLGVCSRAHAGLDLRASAGERIYAIASGTVRERAFSEEEQRSTLMIEGDDGSYRILYLHMSSIEVALTPGQRVAAGTPIGKAGSVGTQVAHLHIEVWPQSSPHFQARRRAISGSACEQGACTTPSGFRTKLCQPCEVSALTLDPVSIVN